LKRNGNDELQNKKSLVSVKSLNLFILNKATHIKILLCTRFDFHITYHAFDKLVKLLLSEKHKTQKLGCLHVKKRSGFVEGPAFSQPIRTF